MLAIMGGGASKFRLFEQSHELPIPPLCLALYNKLHSIAAFVTFVLWLALRVYQKSLKMFLKLTGLSLSAVSHICTYAALFMV